MKFEDRRNLLEFEYLTDAVLRLKFEFNLAEKARARDIIRLNTQLSESYDDDDYLESLTDAIKRIEFEGPMLKREHLRELEYLNISIEELSSDNLL